MTTHRRRFLRLCGVAGIGAIAGCSNESQERKDPKRGEDETQSPFPNNTPTAALTPMSPGTTTLTQTNANDAQQIKFAPSDSDSTDYFGGAVAVSSDGTTALIGAWGDEDPNGNNAGSAYVFEIAGGSWSQQAKLSAADGDGGDFFGFSVALSSDGTTAIIGAPTDEDPNGNNAGSAYVFDNSGGSWTQQTKLTAVDGDISDEFGRSVALSSDGTTALIGAQFDRAPNEDTTGSAYVFDSDGDSWDQQARLAADDGENYDEFGCSVEVSSDGTTALIGAWDDTNSNGEDTGSAYVFSSSGGSWSQQTKLSAYDANDGDEFGWSVGLSGDGTTALVGARFHKNTNGEGAGSAYVFNNSGGSWNRQAEIIDEDGDEEDGFGGAVALSNDGTTALIASDRDEDPNGPFSGSAHVFETSGGSWTQQVKLTAEDGDSDDYLGDRVALSSDASTALIGAHRDEDPHGEDAGSAYVFNL